MTDIAKVDMSHIWAETGDRIAPDPSKVDAGWGAEVPTYQEFNWQFNRLDKNVAYLLQKGFPEWDATTEYVVNKSYVQHLGVVYRALQTATNKNPATEPTYWAVAFNTTEANSRAPVIAVSASRAISASDEGKYLNTTGSVVLTVASQSTANWPLYSRITVRVASGDVALAGDVGVTLNAPHWGTLDMTAGMLVTLTRVAENEWNVDGQTTPSESSPFVTA